MPTGGYVAPTTVASRLADRFDEEGIDYALGGALALGAWGVPRATSDVDVAALVPESELERLLDTLERAGVVVDRQDSRRTVARAGMLVARLGRTRIDVFISHHPWHDDLRARRVLLPTPDGKQRWFLSVEDTVIAKLIYSRAKDLLDLERLFAVQAGRLDVDYVRRWLQRMVPAGDARLAALEDLARRFPAG